MGLTPSVAQHIDTSLIFHDININDSTKVLDIELNLWVLMWLISYHVSQILVIYRMLKVFYNEFHKWGYTEFSRLDQYIRSTLMETFMAKEIYMITTNNYVNQCLDNLITDQQLLV